MFAFSRFSTLSGPSRLGAASLNPTYPCSSKSLASTSRLSPAVLLHTGLTRRTYHSATSKGKEREPDTSMIHPLPINATANLSRKTSRYLSRRYPQATPTHVQSGTLLRTAQCRNFHSTSPRSAIPLIPAGLVIFKSTSILAVVTTVSRILISFFPLGTIAALRSVRGVRWLSEDSRTPTVGPEADEFWRMWCSNERAIKPTRDEAQSLLESNLDSDGSISLPNGRKAWLQPLHPRHNSSKWKNYDDPAYLRNDPQGEFRGIKEKAKLAVLMNRRFFLPPLPTSSIPYFDRLDPSIQTEVLELRRYWVSLHAFKDQLFWSRIIVFTLLLLPCILLFALYLCALERVPFTGRWRIILLTAEDEDQISNSLAGPHWFKAVINLLTTPQAPAPPVLPLSDWRWKWVEGVLRHLEEGIIAKASADAAGVEDHWGRAGDLQPPPSKYPLRPRPRVASRLHSALPGGDPGSGKEHLELGPPFSLMLMEKDERNAFSYGFGGKGAGGVVVFTGLLDDILAQDNPDLNVPSSAESTPKSTGIFGGLFSSAPPPRQSARSPQPTEEQTLHLASVLAHELGHLLLSHHLETLSQQQVLWPSLLGLSMDLIRAFIWPFTIFLGPAVNDALASMGRSTTEELVDRYGEIGFQFKHEYEADLVGLRILARAGFDPKSALTHFGRSISELHEIQPLDRDDSGSWTGSLFKLWTRATHPTSESRLARLEEELARWVKRQQ